MLQKRSGTSVGMFVIFDQLHRYIEENHVNIAVLTVPADGNTSPTNWSPSASWRRNFAPKDIKVPSGVVLQRTDLATSFAVLSAKVKRVMEHRELKKRGWFVVEKRLQALIGEWDGSLQWRYAHLPTSRPCSGKKPSG